MTVGTTLRVWSATAANNSPKGTDVIGTSADDELRQIQATIRQYLASQSSTVVPSAGVADLTTATGHWVPISGSSTLTGFGAEDAGIEYICLLTGSPTINNGSNVSTPGGVTIVGQSGDIFVAESQGSSVWKIWGYTEASNQTAIQSALITQETVSGGSGGSSTASAWTTRPLNTASQNQDSLVSLSSNQITLQAGTYEVTAWQTVLSALSSSIRGTARFRNVTDSATVALGEMTGAGTVSGESALITIIVPTTRFTISGAKAFELQYYITSALASTGLGSPVTSGENERFAAVYIRKITKK